MVSKSGLIFWKRVRRGSDEDADDFPPRAPKPPTTRASTDVRSSPRAITGHVLGVSRSG